MPWRCAAGRTDHVDEQMIRPGLGHQHADYRAAGFEQVHAAGGDQRVVIGQHRRRRLADPGGETLERRVDAGHHGGVIAGLGQPDAAAYRGPGHLRCATARRGPRAPPP
jgi:hypothetical protein